MTGGGVTIGFSGLDQLEALAVQVLGASDALPHTREAVEAGITVLQAGWIERADNDPQLKIHRVSGDYIRGIENGLELSHEGNPYAAAVVNRSPHAAVIEHGAPRHDLKQGLLTGKGAKWTTDGKSKYVDVPLRHRTPLQQGQGGSGAGFASVMPHAVHVVASQLGRYVITGERTITIRVQRPGQPTQTVAQKHLTHNVSARLGSQFGPRYQGMRKAGRAGQSEYITWRRVSTSTLADNPSAWVLPAQEPRPLAQRTAEELEPTVRQIIEQGLRADIKEAFGG